MICIPRPTPGQLAWQAKEFGFFFHFGINTFHNKDWSAGQHPPSTFNPHLFDPDQWLDVAQEAGARYIVFTAKHHDGFCLWPTATTDYSVSSSPFPRDIVAGVAKACERAKMPFGIYLSPWDRNSPVYQDAAAYDRFYIAQMTELCTQYGELFEIWLDGAGSEGRTYDWDGIMKVINHHQPQAMIFNMGNPTIRWGGNEDGLADDPCYYAFGAASAEEREEKRMGIAASAPGEKQYLPVECDVPLRQNWFWQDDDAHTTKSLEHLLGMYYRSVGNGANLLLNVGPNRDGLIDESDRVRLGEMRRELQNRFANPHHALLHNNGDSYEADFGGPVKFDHLILREQLKGGQRIDGYRVINADTNEAIAGITVGYQKWHVFPVHEARRLKIQFSASSAPEAMLTELSVFSTNHSHLPELHAPYDMEMQRRKADFASAQIAPWRA